jgi:hypothetical protein
MPKREKSRLKKKDEPMNYIFKGNLRGFYCGDCYDFLYQAKIRIYAVDKQADITSLAVAREKETFHQRSADELKAISKRLLAEAVTDEAGNFSIDLSDKQKYDGSAFDIDFECGTVPIKPGPKLPPKPRGPFQFNVTTHQPLWRESNEGQRVAYWEYGITYKFWCWLLRLFGLYVICGKVVDCETKIPLSGLKVKAYDVDLLQDDYLGDGTTDSTGHFKIYYTEAEFSKTIFPWLNIEWPAGPDLYFSVETGSGNILMKEPRSRGHQKDRENAPNCFCVELCVKGNGGSGTYAPVLFTHVGNYWIPSGFDANGFTNDAQRNAFTKDIPLQGAVPAPYSSTALEYRFKVKNLTTLVEVDVTPTYIAPFVIGSWNRHTPPPPFESDAYWVNNPAAAHNVVVQPDGWIRVPRENNWTGVEGQFAPGDTLAVLKTDELIQQNFNLIAPAVYVAGTPFAAAQKGAVHYFEIKCQVREVGSMAIEYENVLSRIAICNVNYQMRLHPSWAGYDRPAFGAVMLELQETTLTGAGCNKVSNQLTAHYSVVHPVVESATISFEGNGTLPPSFAVPISPAGDEAVGNTAPQFDITALDPCAYIVWLSASLRLTSGYGRRTDATITDHIAFCKA